MSIYCGISVSPKSSQITIVNEEEEIIYTRVLPNDLNFILEKLQSFEDHGQIGLVIAGQNPQWLVNGLIAVQHTVYVPIPNVEEEYNPVGYKDGLWDSEWLARTLQTGGLPEEYFYLARYDSKLSLYVCEHIHAFSQLVGQMFGNEISKNYELAVTNVANKNKWALEFKHGKVRVRPHELSVEQCRDLIKQAMDHAIKIVGRNQVEEQMQRTRNMHVSKYKYKVSDQEVEGPNKNMSYLEMLDIDGH